MNSGGNRPADSQCADPDNRRRSRWDGRSDIGRDSPPFDPVVETRLANALERVAHGATVSFPSILFQRGLTIVITAILTNGFAAGTYGLYVLAKKILDYLSNSTTGFVTGLCRFLPTATPEEQDTFATIASLLMLGVGAVVGVGLFLAAPPITRVLGHGPRFQLFVQVFALGLPGTLWVQTVYNLLQGLEDVEMLNLLFRIGFPTLELTVVGIGTVLLGDLLVVAGGIVVGTTVAGLVLTAWLIRNRGFSPRLRGTDAATLRRRYLRFSMPLVCKGIVVNARGLSFYLLIAVALSGVAGAVFAVGGVVGSVVRLPLVLNNQFMSPVVADLHDNGHRDALVGLFQVTSRMVLIGSTGIAIPVLVYRGFVMRLFGPTFVEYATLLAGFVLARLAASAAGSVSIVLEMTDHQRALLVIDTLTAVVVVGTAVPLTLRYGLEGLVVSYLLKDVANNGLEIAVLYYLDGYHPFTYRHAHPLVATIPFLLTALAVKSVLSGIQAPLVGTLLGLVAFGTALHLLGFTATERRVVRSLVRRYGATVSITD